VVMKLFLISTLLFITLIGYGEYMKDTYVDPSTQPPLAVTTPAPTPKPTPTPAPVPTPVTPAPQPAPTPVPVPTPTTLACGSGGTCSAADVAKHSSASDCWIYTTTVNKVFDISSYITGQMHPGGDVITPFCGQDLSTFFTTKIGGHAHSAFARNFVLNNSAWFIGALK
jgi:hypothetical protein